MEADSIRLARTWEEVLRERLLERFGQLRGHELAARWLDAFSPAYKLEHRRSKSRCTISNASRRS